MSEEQFDVCYIGGRLVRGSKREAIAARLEHGDRILLDGKVEVVNFTWAYETVMVNLMSGRTLCSEFDRFSLLCRDNPPTQ